MGWFKKKNKEKEEKNPPDKPQPVKSASRRELVKILDKIWEPYDNDREEFKAEVHYCQHLMNLVYDIYVRRGSRRQKQLLADLFSENQLPRNNKQRSDWVRSVGSMILTEEALKDELELSVGGLNPTDICAARRRTSRLTCTTANVDLPH